LTTPRDEEKRGGKKKEKKKEGGGGSRGLAALVTALAVLHVRRKGDSMEEGGERGGKKEKKKKRKTPGPPYSVLVGAGQTGKGKKKLEEREKKKGESFLLSGIREKGGGKGLRAVPPFAPSPAGRGGKKGERGGGEKKTLSIRKKEGDTFSPPSYLLLPGPQV